MRIYYMDLHMVYQECVTVREDDSEYHQNLHTEMSMEVRLKVIQLCCVLGVQPQLKQYGSIWM